MSNLSAVQKALTLKKEELKKKEKEYEFAGNQLVSAMQDLGWKCNHEEDIDELCEYYRDQGKSETDDLVLELTNKVQEMKNVKLQFEIASEHVKKAKKNIQMYEEHENSLDPKGRKRTLAFEEPVAKRTHAQKRANVEL